MTSKEHDRAAVHHRREAHTHEAAADLAQERGDNLGAEQHREAHAWHLSAAHHHETQATLGRLSFAEVPATARANLPTHEAAFT